MAGFLDFYGETSPGLPQSYPGHPTPGGAPGHSYYLDNVDHAAQLIREMGYPVADVNAVCCTPDQMYDYGHPNERGHEVIAQAVLEALRFHYAGLDK